MIDDSLFAAHDLGDGLQFHASRLPEELIWGTAQFDEAWALHPEIRPSIHLHGRMVQIPRWQQAYGDDYHFSGQVSRAEPVPDLLRPLLDWSRRAIHPSLSGLLVNWYEGPSQYIGPHRDQTGNLIPGTPIVTISFGETRTFRLSRGVGREKQTLDFPAPNGTIFVLPYATNRVWKHAVPKSTRYVGRRISITLRAFQRT